MIDKFYASHLKTSQVRKQLHAFPNEQAPKVVVDKKKTETKKTIASQKTVSKKTPIKKKTVKKTVTREN